MSRSLYELFRWPIRTVDFICLRKVVLHGERIKDRPGGFVLASSHISHMEPLLASLHTRRQVHWMSRVEFYKYGFGRLLLKAVDAFPVNRQKPAPSTLKTAISHAAAGRVVGICPEGGVKIGHESALRGGPIRHGALFIAQRTGVPIVPVAMAGTRALSKVGPWLPARRGKVWIAVGEPIDAPSATGDRRANRRETAEQLRRAYQALYQELLETTDLKDDHDAPWLEQA